MLQGLLRVKSNVTTHIHLPAPLNNYRCSASVKQTEVNGISKLSSDFVYGTVVFLPRDVVEQNTHCSVGISLKGLGGSDIEVYAEDVFRGIVKEPCNVKEQYPKSD